MDFLFKPSQTPLIQAVPMNKRHKTCFRRKSFHITSTLTFTPKISAAGDDLL